TFEIDTNGILNVTAVNKTTNQSKNLTITNNKGRFTDSDIDRLIEEAKRFEEQDKRKKESIEARNDLENFAHRIKNSDKFTQKCADILEFIDSHPNEDKDIYVEKKKELEDLLK